LAVEHDIVPFDWAVCSSRERSIPAYEKHALKAYRLWLSLFELYRYYSWIIDRFHLSTQMWQAFYRGRKYQFQWLESRLSALGFRLIFCWRNPRSFAEARAKRLQISSNPSQYNDLTIFIREQEILQQLVEDSTIPKLLVDVTYRSLEQQIDYIASWLEATGGLNVVQSPPDRKTPLLPQAENSFPQEHDRHRKIARAA
jgi:hypothetical protein